MFHPFVSVLHNVCVFFVSIKFVCFCSSRQLWLEEVFVKRFDCFIIKPWYLTKVLSSNICCFLTAVVTLWLFHMWSRYYVILYEINLFLFARINKVLYCICSCGWRQESRGCLGWQCVPPPVRGFSWWKWG